MNFAAFDVRKGTNANVQRQFTKYFSYNTCYEGDEIVCKTSDIMAVAVLSTEKSCLAAHATCFLFVAVLNALLKN